jgi:putative flavoprotein involved in K+ transport
MDTARQPPRAESESGDRGDFGVVVVGAGQAGLAIGYFLARQGRRFVILEAGESIGQAWRTRWNSLVLFTSRRYSGLPGLPFPGDPEGYATRDEVLEYLEQYAATFKLPVRLGTPVRRLGHAAGRFGLELDGGRMEADQVVVATGPFQVPRIPPIPGQLAPDVFQVHSTGYMEPSDVPAGTVVVVGGGNTGFQIAKELSATRLVHLAVGSRMTPLPQRFLGRDLFWWLTKTGLIKKTVESRIGQRLQHREDTLIGSSARQIRRLGVELKPRLTGASGRLVSFADGSTLEVDAVIWATGYRSDYAWIDAPVFDSDGQVKHRRGVTDVPGLYFLGMPWQYTRGSALIGWVKDDAEFIAEQSEASAKGRPPEREPPEHETLGAS